MLNRWWRLGMLVVALAGVGSAGASDYQRELKWADEIKAGLVVGDAIEMRTSLEPAPFLTLFAPGDPGRAVILVHGMGVHPDWGLIGAMRVALNNQGYTTLSIQMPILPIEATPDQYGELTPAGAARISRAVSFLEGQGYGKIALVSHSLGSHMGLLYMTNRPNPVVRSWASLGSPDFGYETVKVPVLDLYGEADNKTVLANAAKRAKTFENKQSKQVMLKGADHFYEGHNDALIKTVGSFLEKTLGKAQPPGSASE